MSGACFVTGLGAWTPWHPSLAAWCAGTEGARSKPVGRGLPRGVARRATALTAMAADVLADATEASGVGTSEIGLVLATVAGELALTFDTLALTTAQPPSSSPLRFRNSVHNAALGHLGIAYANEGYASALSASAEGVVAMGLLEGMAWMAQHGGHVAVVWAEDLWPDRSHPPAAAGILLSAAPQHGARVWGRLEVPTPVHGAQAAAVPGPVGTSPIAGAFALVSALASATEGSRVPLSSDGARPWSAHFEPVAP